MSLVVDRNFRDHVRYTGDGLPNEPVGHPLPIGDPSSGVYNPTKEDMRGALDVAGDSADDADAAAAAAVAAASAATAAASAASAAASAASAAATDATTAIAGLGDVASLDLVDNAHMTDMATATIKGRATAGTGDPEDLTAAQAKNILDLALAVTFRGNHNASLGVFPGAGVAKIGWEYRISTAGTIGGVYFRVNDYIRASVDNASTTVQAGNWVIIPTITESERNVITTVLTSPAGTGVAITANSDKIVQGASRFSLQPPVTNTGNVTLAVTHPNGVTAALPLRDASGAEFAPGHLRANRIYELRYATTQWLITNADEASLLSNDVSDALDSDLRRVLVGRFDGGLNGWTGTTAGSPVVAAASPPAASVLFGVDGIQPILRFNDLTAVGVIPAGMCDLVAVIPGRIYRITADLRLTGATILGVDQAQVQHLLLNADFSVNSTGVSSPALDLTSGWGTFTFDWDSTGTTAAWIRGRVFKRSAYTDTTGTIQCRRFDISDVTGGGQVPERLTDLQAGQARFKQHRSNIAATVRKVYELPVPTIFQGRTPWNPKSSKWQPLQPTFAQSMVELDTGTPKLDLSYVIMGSEITVRCDVATQFFAGRNATFAGQGASNHLAVPAGSLVVLRVFDLPFDGRLIFAQVVMGAPTWTTVAEPVMEETILGIGQSNWVWFARSGGVGGFAQALRDGLWMTEGIVDRSISWVQGGTGGTAILRAHSPDADSWWFDPDEIDPDQAWGPAMDTCIAQIDASIAAGQPVPETIVVSQGEADIAGLQNNVSTVAEFQAGVQAVWGHIRDYLIAEGAVAPKVIYIGLGSRENQTQFNQRKGASGVRTGYMDAIAATAWAHLGVEAYDVGRAPSDIHYQEFGYYVLGRRLAKAWANVTKGATYDLGPVVSGLALSTDRKMITLSHSSPTRTLAMPAGEALGRTYGTTPEKDGGAPMLYTVVNDAGTPLLIDFVQVEGTKVEINLPYPLPVNARVVYPGGFAAESLYMDFVRDYSTDIRTGSPGMPLRTYISAPIA